MLLAAVQGCGGAGERSSPPQKNASVLACYSPPWRRWAPPSQAQCIAGAAALLAVADGRKLSCRAAGIQRGLLQSFSRRPLASWSERSRTHQVRRSVVVAATAWRRRRAQVPWRHDGTVVQHEARERDGRQEQQHLGRPPHLRARAAVTLLVVVVVRSGGAAVFCGGGAAMCACVRKSARLGSARRRTHGLGTSRGRQRHRPCYSASTSSPPRSAAASTRTRERPAQLPRLKWPTLVIVYA